MIESKSNNKVSAISYYDESINERIIKVIVDSNCQSDYGKFIFILDSSFTMRYILEKIIKKLIPQILCKLSYPDEEKFYIINFANDAFIHEMTKKEFTTNEKKIESIGSTYMEYVPDKILEILNNIELNSIINLLIFSDCKLRDVEETKTNMKKINNFINEKNIRFNCQFVIFENSDKEDEPEFSVLYSFLSLNNIKNIEPITIKLENEKEFSDKEIISYSLLISEKFNIGVCGWKIVSKQKKLRYLPFGDEFHDSIILTNKNSICYYNERNASEIHLENVNDSSVKDEIVDKGNLNEENKSEFYTPHFYYKVSQTMIENVQKNPENGKKENEKILKKFRDNCLIKDINEKIGEIKDIKELNIYINTQIGVNKSYIESIAQGRTIIPNNLNIIILIDYSENMKDYLIYFIDNILIQVFEKMNIKNRIPTIINGMCKNLTIKIKNIYPKIEEMKEENLFMDSFKLLIDRIQHNKDKINLIIVIFSKLMKNINTEIYESLSQFEKSQFEICSNVIKLSSSDIIETNSQLEENKILYGIIKQISSKEIDKLEDFNPLIVDRNEIKEKGEKVIDDIYSEFMKYFKKKV